MVAASIVTGIVFKLSSNRSKGAGAAASSSLSAGAAWLRISARSSSCPPQPTNHAGQSHVRHSISSLAPRPAASAGAEE
eukprot:3431249-Rhodomonas_salina.1